MAIAVFFGAHQDDETLNMGGGIANHVAAGHQVFTACITDGKASACSASMGFAQTPEGLQAFSDLRTSEMQRSLTQLGATLVESTYKGRLGDGTLDPLWVSSNHTDAGYSGHDIQGPCINMDVVYSVDNILTQIENSTGVNRKLFLIKTHSHMDAHPDHRAICRVLIYMLNRTEIVNLRHYSSCDQWDKTVKIATTTFPKGSTIGVTEEKPVSATSLIGAIRQQTGSEAIYAINDYAGLAGMGKGVASHSVFPLCKMVEQVSTVTHPLTVDVTTTGRKSTYHLSPTPITA